MILYICTSLQGKIAPGSGFSSANSRDIGSAFGHNVLRGCSYSDASFSRKEKGVEVLISRHKVEKMWLRV